MASNTLQLNQLINIFATLAAKHKMVAEFGFGSAWNLNVKQVNYPYVYVEPLGSLLLDRANNQQSTPNALLTEEYTFRLYCLDVINKGDGNYNEVLSDTKYILDTMLAEIDQHQFFRDLGLQLVQDLRFVPIFEETKDNTNGWYVDLNWRLKFRYTPCNVPIAPIAGWTYSLNSNITEYRLIGATGPIGPTGPDGPTGPTGPGFSGSFVDTDGNIIINQIGNTVSFALAPTISVCQGIYTDNIFSCDTGSFINLIDGNNNWTDPSVGGFININTANTLINLNDTRQYVTIQSPNSNLTVGDGRNIWSDNSGSSLIILRTTLSSIQLDDTGIYLDTSGLISVGNNRIQDVSDGINPLDAVNVSQLTALGAGYLPLVGGTMSGNIDMGGNNLWNVQYIGGPLPYSSYSPDIDLLYKQLKFASVIKVDWQSEALYTQAGYKRYDWLSNTLYNNIGATAIDLASYLLYDSNSNLKVSIDYDNRFLFKSDGTSISIDYSNGVDVSFNKITSVATGSNPLDAVNVSQLLSITSSIPEIRSGYVIAGSFSGIPLNYTVTFSSPMTTANYSPTVIGGDLRSWSVSNLTVNGFNISANSNIVLSNKVYWTATKNQ